MAEKRYTFDDIFQWKIISLMATDPHFVTSYKEVLNPKYFTSKPTSDFCNIISNFIVKYNCLPTEFSLNEEIKVFTEGAFNRAFRQEYLNYCPSIFEIPQEDRNYVIERVVDFGRRAAINDAILEVMELNSKESPITKIEEIMSKAFTVGNLSDDEGYEYFDNYENRFKNYNKPFEVSIPTGIEELDRYIHSGGVQAGWLCFLLGPTNSGKSIFLENIAFNVSTLYRKNVLFASTEMDNIENSERFDQMLTEKPLREFRNNFEAFEMACKARRSVSGRLLLHALPKSTLSANKLKALIERDMVLKQFKPDIVIVDYADEMIPNHGVTSDKIGDAKAVFDDLGSLAQQLKLPIWTATQGNGASFNLQREGKNLGLDNTGGAKAKTFGAHLVISGIRLNYDKNTGIGSMQYSIIKNRRGPNDITIGADVNYNTMRILPKTLQIGDSNTVTDDIKELRELFKDAQGEEE